jgi:hypothetical protein
VDREYHPLPIRELGAGAGFRRPTQAASGRASAGSPALEALPAGAEVARTFSEIEAALVK